MYWQEAAKVFLGSRQPMRLWRLWQSCYFRNSLMLLMFIDALIVASEK